MIKIYKIDNTNILNEKLIGYLDNVDNGVTKVFDKTKNIYIVDTNLCDVTTKVSAYKRYECELKNINLEEEVSIARIERDKKLNDEINRLQHIIDIRNNLDNFKAEELAKEKFDELCQRFVKEEVTYDELCELYKDKIKAEIIIRSKTKNDDFSYSEADRKIREYKNKIVDEIVSTTLTERGKREYPLIMQKASKLADTIEEFIWTFKI